MPVLLCAQNFCSSRLTSKFIIIYVKILKYCAISSALFLVNLLLLQADKRQSSRTYILWMMSIHLHRLKDMHHPQNVGSRPFNGLTSFTECAFERNVFCG